MIDLKNLIESLDTNWKNILNQYTDNDNFNTLQDFLNSQSETIYPKPENIFACFNKFNFEDLKVVLIGQDPYHGPNQAMGLSFSVPEKTKVLPPSLRNIFKELETDIGKREDRCGDLSNWANQGVLLLNTSLSVTRGKANSHSKYWTWLSDEIIKYISQNNQHIVFMLWGNHARKLKQFIDTDKHHVLEATHPSPLGAAHGGWFDCKHFSKTNSILEANNKGKIDWIKK